MTTPSGTTLVSVVIPARNAAHTIDAQLESLTKQDYEGPFEVVVANNRSTDDTANRARSWQDRLPGLRVVDASDRPGAAYARNVGISAALGARVLLCDADDLTDPGWVRTLATALETSDAVCGGTVEFHDVVPSDAPHPRPFGNAGFAFLPGLIGCSCGFWRSVWEAIGGFDEQFGVATVEDLDFGWRLQLAGFTLDQVPDGFVYYRTPRDLRVVYRTWLRYGRYQPALRKRFGPHGLPREDALHVAVGWARLVFRSYRAFGSGPAARIWYRDLGRRVGRLIGSVRERTLYL